MEIKLIKKEEIFSIIPLLKVLNSQIADDTLKHRLTEMVSQGYECVGVYEQKKLIGICGLWILTKHYVGKHIEPDNVIFLPEYRSMGLGHQLMAWVYDYGRRRGCIASELNCYLSNESGQRFWEREGYKAIGYHYQKYFFP